MKPLIHETSSAGKEKAFRSTSVDLLEGQDLDRDGGTSDLFDEATMKQ